MDRKMKDQSRKKGKKGRKKRMVDRKREHI